MRMNAKIADVGIGDILIADAGFTCLSDKEECVVKADPKGKLFVHCDDGRHYLEGQEQGDEYIGFQKKK